SCGNSPGFSPGSLLIAQGATRVRTKIQGKINHSSRLGRTKVKDSYFWPMRMRTISPLVPIALALALVWGCGDKKGPRTDLPVETQGQNSTLVHAKGFSIERHNGFTVIEVHTPWPGAQKSFKYFLAPKERL